MLAAVSCSLLGVYVVFRRMAFVGDAMAHTALPGLVIAHAQGWSLFAGALASNAVTAGGIAALSGGPLRRRGLREDTAIGVVFTAMLALGILLMSLRRSFLDFTHLLFGSILGVGTIDLVLLGAVSIIVILCLALLHKELELSSYDPVYAEQIGIRTRLLRLLLLGLLALAVVSGIRVVGVILTSALLVTPAATAALLARRLLPLMVIATAIGTGSMFLGLLLSFPLALAPGACVVLLCAATFIVAWAWRRSR